MKPFLPIFCLAFLAKAALAQPALDLRLFELPDVVFKKIETPEGFEACYELKIRQPLDHKNPAKGFFYQKAYLTHKGFDRPTVIATEGYDLPANRIYEPTRLLEANQLDVEHRYFGKSKPADSLEFTHLNLEQATADLHHINQIFRQLYPGKWVSTGISKGGQTTIFYRWFFPDDVDASIPYVAPLNLELEEKRIYGFLDTVGSDECRAKILALQTRILKERDKVLPLLRWYEKGAGLNFSYLTPEQAFEYAVLEYSFSFWQLGHDCSKIPDAKVSLDSALAHLLEVSNVDFFSDKQMAGYASHYWQAGTEMGYYGYETEDFKGLLKALPAQPHPSAVFLPGKKQAQFDPALPNKVANWLKTSGNRFIYINGASDTWSATSVPPSGKVDAVWFFMEGKDHRGARIRNMTPEQKEKLVATLERWLDLKISGSVKP